ncbi:hypothetical protein CRE_14550 [Caenorhabditis remanei]|uniref:F-box domain-containing protein n=1 Tax=Caenorhabditis remanei TaxID=31234 RepID=E3M9H4_CAERE|nr:hypothetical protein CRE_14550 [Caenorhabditis remanei]
MPPLTYLSLKIILPYMDLNTRVNLSLKCPSISQILKHLPVTIDHIQLGITNITINGTTYTLHSHANSAHAVPKDNNHQLVGKHFIRLSRDVFLWSQSKSQLMNQIIMEQTEFNRQLVPIHRNAYLKNVAYFRWQMMYLIIFWKEGNCAVGTHLAMETTGGFGLESMRFPVEDELVGRKGAIKNKMSNQDVECINVPMENNLEINIYIEQLNPESNIVHFEVYPHGYAIIV